MSSFTLRTRRPRFSVEELKALVSAVEKVKSVLYGPRVTVLNSEVREQAWIEISEAVNAVSQVKRSTTEIRKKWADWSSVVKRKSMEMEQRSAEHQGTVTISSKFITPTERRLLAILDTKSGHSAGPTDTDNSDNPARVKLEGVSSSQSNSAVENSLGFSGSDHDSSNMADAETANFGSTSHLSGEFQQGSSTRGPASDKPSHRFRNASDDFLDESESTPFQNGTNSDSSKQRRIVKHSDVLLALKRKKLRVLEEQVKVERERLEVEKGILQILKEMQGRRNRTNDLL